MIEKQSINGKDVWIKVDAHTMDRENPHTIPTEYFSAACYFCDPLADIHEGQAVKDEEGRVKLFESPVAALTAARKQMEDT